MEQQKTVILDPGHGGAEPGAIYEGRKEKDDNLRLALAVGRILERNGVNVLLTRIRDVYEHPYEKAEIGNRSGADFFVSLHRNAMPQPNTASGIESLVYENSGIRHQLAQNINEALHNMTGYQNLGIQERPGLAVLRKTQMPAVLVEAGFIDNEEDNQTFDEKFDAVASAIAQGILKTIREEEAAVPEYYQIQTGAYRDRRLARQLEERLKTQGFPAFLVYQEPWYQVRVGAFLNMDNAAAMEQKLRQYGYPTMMGKGEGCVLALSFFAIKCYNYALTEWEGKDKKGRKL